MNKWFLPIFSGILLILTYPPFSLLVFPFLSFLPLFFFLNFKVISLKKSFLAGLITGFIFSAGLWRWLFDVIPMVITEIRGEFLNYFLLVLVWFISSLFFALFFGIFSAVYSYLKSNGNKNILLVPSLWVTFEYLRTWGFGLFLAGKGYLPGAHWTVGNLAYSLAQNDVFRLSSSIGGIYLVSFLIVLINFILFLLIKKRHLSVVLIVLFLIVGSYFLVLPQTAQDGKTLKVAVLQTRFVSSLDSMGQVIKEKSETQSRLLGTVRKDYPESDVVIFPEGSDFLGQNKIEPDYFGDKDVLIIDSRKTSGKNGKYLGTFYSTKNGVLGEYQKILLIPFGDYLPYFFKVLVKIFNLEELEWFGTIKNREKGEELVIFSVPGDGNAGLLFCSEAASPDLHRELSRKGAQVIFNAGGLAFSGGSINLDHQILAMLQFRAAENGKYLVRSTNYGWSYIINDKGELVNISSDVTNRVVSGEVTLVPGTTFYSRWGDWILLLAILILIPFVFLRFRR